MRAGVAVAANDCHPRLGQPQFRSNHVYDSLIRRVHIEKPHAKFLTVALQRCNLLRRNKIRNRGAPRLGGNVVVNGGHGAQGLPSFSPRNSQTIESLRRRDFMDQMKIDVNNGRSTAGFRHQMGVPYLLEKCFPCRHLRSNPQRDIAPEGESRPSSFSQHADTSKPPPARPAQSLKIELAPASLRYHETSPP